MMCLQGAAAAVCIGPGAQASGQGGPQPAAALAAGLAGLSVCRVIIANVTVQQDKEYNDLLLQLYLASRASY